MSSVMDELDALLAELESTKRTLSILPSPVSFQENVAITFANSMQNAIQATPVPESEATVPSQQAHIPKSSIEIPETRQMYAFSTKDNLFAKQAAIAENINQSEHPTPSDRRPKCPPDLSTQSVLPSLPNNATPLRQSNGKKDPDTSNSKKIVPNIQSDSPQQAWTQNVKTDTTSSTDHSISKRSCSQCQKPIIGAYVRALDKDWHMDHLSCSVCNKVLTPTTIYEQEGTLYCQQHYSELNETQCAFCQGAITDRCVVALNKHWHVDHFFCSQCGKPLTSVGFMEHQGKAYCDEDYFALFAPHCGACTKPVMADCFAALNQSWHPGCFVCTKCATPFKNGVFFSHEDKPYCETHYHFMRGSLCPGCNKPIVGKCVNAIGKRWHPEHFACSFCATALNKMPFREKEGTAFCVPCHTRLYG